MGSRAPRPAVVVLYKEPFAAAEERRYAHTVLLAPEHFDQRCCFPDRAASVGGAGRVLSLGALAGGAF